MDKPLELMILTLKKRISIVIMYWQVSELKGMENKVGTVIGIDIEIAVGSIIVIGGERTQGEGRYKCSIGQSRYLIKNRGIVFKIGEGSKKLADMP